MKGRIWLIAGVVVGVLVGIDQLAYFSGAARSLSATAERLVSTGGLTLIHSSAKHGAPKRVVEGAMAVLAVVVPGVTAFLVMLAARCTLRLRALIALAVSALGFAAFFYLPGGDATGVVFLALATAAIALMATGPLVAAPLAALAALVGTVYLPRLLYSSSIVSKPVATLHEALFSTAGSPLWLRVVVLLIAALPFAFAGRLVLR